jgi:hypothetical protein
MTTATFVNNASVLQDVHNITLNAFNSTFSNIPDLVLDFQYTPIPHHVAEQSLARGGNIMGLNNTLDDLISKLKLTYFLASRHVLGSLAFSQSSC